MTAFILGLVLLSHPERHFHAFLFDGECVVLDKNGTAVAQLNLKTIPELSTPSDVDVSPDGTRLAVTAWSAEVNNTLLFELTLATRAVRRIGEAKGFHAAPSYSRDGLWIQFAHHATLGGPVGMHELRQYAQLYRQRSDGSSAPEQLTTSEGCHMESASVRGDAIYFAHSNCKGGRRIELLTAGREAPITTFESHLGEPDLSLDGRWLVATRVTGDLLEIVELNLAHPETTQTLWSSTRSREQFRPHYSGSGRAVVFQNGAVVYELSQARPKPALKLIWSFQ